MNSNELQRLSTRISFFSSTRLLKMPIPKGPWSAAWRHKLLQSTYFVYALFLSFCAHCIWTLWTVANAFDHPISWKSMNPCPHLCISYSNSVSTSKPSKPYTSFPSIGGLRIRPTCPWKPAVTIASKLSQFWTLTELPQPTYDLSFHFVGSIFSSVQCLARNSSSCCYRQSISSMLPSLSVCDQIDIPTIRAVECV